LMLRVEGIQATLLMPLFEVYDTRHCMYAADAGALMHLRAADIFDFFY